MANKNINQLPSAGTIADSDKLPIQQTTTNEVTASALKAYMNQIVRVSLTDASTIAWNFSQGNFGDVGINSDIRQINISNVSGIQSGILRVKHLQAGSIIDLPGNIEGVHWSTLLNGYTLLTFLFDGTDYNWSSNISGAVPDTDVPVLQTASIDSGNLTQIILAYNELLKPSSVPDPTDFALSNSKTVTGVSISSSQVLVDINSQFGPTDSPTISYTAGTHKIKDIAGNNAANLTNHAVTVGIISGVLWEQASGCTIGGDGTLTFSTTGGAVSTNPLGGVGSYVEFTQPSDISRTETIILQLAAAKNNSYGLGSAPLQVYQIGGQYYVRVTNSTDIATGITPAAGDIVRLVRTGTNDAQAQYSKDAGATFTTFPSTNGTGCLTGIANPYIKGTNAASGAVLPTPRLRTV